MSDLSGKYFKRKITALSTTEHLALRCLVDATSQNEMQVYSGDRVQFDTADLPSIALNARILATDTASRENCDEISKDEFTKTYYRAMLLICAHYEELKK